MDRIVKDHGGQKNPDLEPESRAVVITQGIRRKDSQTGGDNDYQAGHRPYLGCPQNLSRAPALHTRAEKTQVHHGNRPDRKRERLGCRRTFERHGKSLDYAALTHLAAEAKPFHSLVDPDAAAFLAPADMPAEMSKWCAARGRPAPASEGEFVRTALESLALKYRMVLGWLEELAGSKVEVIHIVGGGSQNELLNQFAANACGLPVVAGPVEATALGNVLVQARTSGALSTLAEMRSVVRASSTLRHYEPRDRSVWTDAYGRFCELLSMP